MSAYLARRAQLLEAIEIASAAEPAEAAHYAELRAQALSDEPAFQNQRSLGTLEVALLTFFRESVGPSVDAFWDGVEDAGLPYSRPNLVGKVLCRGHLRAHEYEVFADGLEHLQDSGQISTDEARSLEAFLDSYEAKHADEFE